MRLQQGDMARATVFHRDPAAQAQAFEAQGFEYLHIVDLDGAFAGKPMNAAAIEHILEAISIPVQLGGGIRDMATIEGWLGKGVNRVIIGTAAVRDPELVQARGEAISRPRRGRARCARRQGRGRRLGRDLGADRARPGAAVRGRGRRGHHLHRHRPRRPAQGPQSRCHHRARRSGAHPGDRLGRPRVDGGRRGDARARAPASSPAPSRAARSTTAGSMPPRRSR